jgi:alpha-galactosidase
MRRDLWTHTDLGTYSGAYTASSVPSGGVVMLKLTSTP